MKNQETVFIPISHFRIPESYQNSNHQNKKRTLFFNKEENVPKFGHVTVIVILLKLNSGENLLE